MGNVPESPVILCLYFYIGNIGKQKSSLDSVGLATLSTASVSLKGVQGENV